MWFFQNLMSTAINGCFPAKEHCKHCHHFSFEGNFLLNVQIFKLFVLCKKETFSSDHLIATLACQGKVARGQIFGKWNVLIQSGDSEPLNNLFNGNRDLAKANVALHCVYESHLSVWSSTSKCSVLVKYHILDRYVVMEHFYFGEKLLFHFSAQNHIAITPRSANRNNHSETSIWQGFLYWNIEYKNKDNQNFFESLNIVKRSISRNLGKQFMEGGYFV